MPSKLSSEMKKYLRYLALNKKIIKNSNTLKALTSRGLYDLEKESLTQKGLEHALLFLSLEEQCRILDIRYEQIPRRNLNIKPEIEALEYFATYGYKGSYCEGGAILILIRAAALDAFAELNAFSREDACTRFTESQLLIHREHASIILNIIQLVSVEMVINNFNEIYNFKIIKELYPGLNEEFIALLFNAIGGNLLSRIAMIIMNDPSFRAGWPDLTLVNESELHWVEVKTSDRLHMSQISIINHIKPILPGEYRILKLTTQKHKLFATKKQIHLI